MAWVSALARAPMIVAHEYRAKRRPQTRENTEFGSGGGALGDRRQAIGSRALASELTHKRASIRIDECRGRDASPGAWQVIVDIFRQVIVDTFWMDAVEKHWEERGAPSVCRGVLETEDEHCRGVPMLRD